MKNRKRGENGKKIPRDEALNVLLRQYGQRKLLSVTSHWNKWTYLRGRLAEMGAPEDIECSSLFWCFAQIALVDINAGQLDVNCCHTP